MTTEEPKTYASQSGHYYDMRDGSPAYEQPCKSRPGKFRSTTLADAKKLGYLAPSVTEILKTTHKPALEQWKMREVVKACIERPIVGGEDEGEYTSYVLNASKEKAAVAAERGTDIHTLVEVFLASGMIHGDVRYINAAMDALEFCVVDPKNAQPEKSFACIEGYGGKVDLHCNRQFARYVIDFKTKDDWEEGDKLGYDEHVMQLAAYANGLGMVQEAVPWPRLISVFISRDVPGKWAVKEWNEAEGVLALKKFRPLLEYWFLDKGYRPNAELRDRSGSGTPTRPEPTE